MGDHGVNALLDANLPRNALAKQLEPMNHGNLLLETAELENLLLQQETPYGPIMQTLEFPPRPGQAPFTTPFANPKALLCALLMISAPFRHLMVQCVEAHANKPGEIILYQDDVKPGNALRPDKGRTYVSWSFSFLWWPRWFAESQVGWFDILFMTLGELKKLPGEEKHANSVVADRLLWEMHGEDWVLDIRKGSDPNSYVLAVQWGLFLADTKALVQMACSTGAGGYKCCLKCPECVGRIPEDTLQEAAGLGFYHYSEGDSTKFTGFTHAEWQDLCGRVREARENQPKKIAQAVETQLGIAFNEGLGVPWGRGATICRGPEDFCFDSMHSLFASGGCAQYEINQVLLRIQKQRILPDHFQEFCNTVHLSGHEKICPDIWQRVNKGSASHIKAFASEILSLIVVLIAFMDWVFVPRNLLPRETECLRLLHTITWILQDNDLAVKKAHSRELDTLFARHHSLFMELYGACQKPKLHYSLVHIPRQIRKWNVHLSCFANERHHRWAKRLAAFVLKHLGSVLLKRCLVHLLREIQDPKYYDPYHLPNPLQRGESMWKDMLDYAGFQVHERGMRMESPIGALCKDDFVTWRMDATVDGFNWAGGFICELIKGRGADGSVQPFVIVNQAVPIHAAATPNCCVFRRQFFRSVVHGQRLLRRMPFLEAGDAYHVIMPEGWRQLLA